MTRYVIKRILLALLTIFLICALTFFLMHAVPGGPFNREKALDAATIQALEERYGLNRPVGEQFLSYMKNVLKGDFGVSLKNGRNITDIFKDSFPISAKLGLMAIAVALVCGVIFGSIAALMRNKLPDRIIVFFSTLFTAVPSFVLATLLLLVFAIKLGWVPVFGAKQWSSIVLPAISLGLMNMASIARTTRSSMVETIRQDYIRTAYAKGLPKRTVIMRHAFRNGLLPTITVIGLEIGQMLGGSVLTETVFAWPGIGRLMIQSVNGRDTPTVMGCIILMTVCFSIVNLLVDLLYGVFDPRVRTMYH